MVYHVVIVHNPRSSLDSRYEIWLCSRWDEGQLILDPRAMAHAFMIAAVPTRLQAELQVRHHFPHARKDYFEVASPSLPPA